MQISTLKYAIEFFYRNPVDVLNLQAEDGKTELSLVHFTLTNPEWRPPAEAENFVMALRNQAIKDAATGTAGGQLHNPLLASINSVSSLGTGVCQLLNSSTTQIVTEIIFLVFERALEHPAQSTPDVQVRDGHAHALESPSAGGQASDGEGRPQSCRRAPGGLGQGAAVQFDPVWTHFGQLHVRPRNSRGARGAHGRICSC